MININMKTKLFTLLFAIVANVGTIFAEKVKIGDLYYNLDVENKTAEVTYPGDYDWPDWTDNITVANIPSSFVYNAENYSVISIGKQAFPGSGLTSVTIPNSITSIGDYAFNDCTGLTSVTFGNGVKYIGKDAFSSCDGLTSFNIPNSVISIGDGAFSYCGGLTSVTIPNSVTSIGRSAFINCLVLMSIEVAADNMNYCSLDGVLFDKNRKTLIQYPGGKQGAYSIPNSVTDIEDAAFWRCKGLTAITIPNSVTNIGTSVFRECTSLTTVSIPNSVTSINIGTFDSCSGLKSVTIPNSVTSIEQGAFWGCDALMSITIPNSVIRIGPDAFWGCVSLTSLNIPNSVKSIGSSAFSNCIGLTSVILGNSITYIGDGAFDRCKSLTNIEIPNSVKSIGRDAFEGCGLTSVCIPNGVKSIGYGAFSGCYLENIIIGVSTDTIGQDAFSYNYLENADQEYIYDEKGKVILTIKSIICYNPNPLYIKDYYDEELGEDYCFLSDDYYFSCDEFPYSAIILYVPASSVAAYKSHRDWGRFDVRPIEAANSDATELQVSTTTSTSVEVVWPSVSGAYTYELIIKDKQGNIVCTLVFDSNGKLTSLVFAAPSRDQSTAYAQGTGFAFTITSLDYNTTYDVTVTAKDSNGQNLYQETKSFTTENAQAIDQIFDSKPESQKLIKDGQLLILRGDHTYTLQGQEVK